MQSSKNSAVKNRITEAIFTGAALMLVVFLVSLLIPKQWIVSGKIVVFPSGQPVSASQNLLPETANTAEIVKSDSFQKAYFGDQAANFAGVKVLRNSSMIRVKFRSSESDIQASEDLVVKIPDQIGEYARDLYGGSPFKYKMANDPEISQSPVRPNLLLNAILGFLGGVLLYLIYWLGFESRKSENHEFEAGDNTEIVSPGIKPAGSTKKKAGEGKIDMKDGRLQFAPGKTEEVKSAAPENLPFVDEPSPLAKGEEPSDEEVKARLNKLMRGEL